MDDLDANPPFGLDSAAGADHNGDSEGSPADASRVLETYKLGNVEVEVGTADRPGRLRVRCWDGTYRSEFEASEYEFTHYRRHMNQKITIAYRRQHEQDSGSVEKASDRTQG